MTEYAIITILLTVFVIVMIVSIPVIAAVFREVVRCCDSWKERTRYALLGILIVGMLGAAAGLAIYHILFAQP